MKTIVYFLIALSLAFVSCTDLLDVEPTDAISADEALKDKEGIKYAITGAYNTLQYVGSYGRNQVVVPDLASDNLDWAGTTPDYQEIDNIPVPAENSIIDGIWAVNYDGINRVNNVLARLPDIIDIGDDERSQFEGECLFLRALFHFNLAEYFGGIPIKTSPTTDLSNLDQARDALPEVLNQVVSDLVAAESLLPATAVPGKASSFSATALLARVYLTQFQLFGDPSMAQLAIAKAGQVIESGGYSLSPNYSDLFNLDETNETEPIFQVVFDAQNSNRLAQYFLPLSLTGRYEFAPTEELIGSYTANDSLRFQASIGFDTLNLPYCNKYTDKVYGTDRVIVVRLAEMYLIRAEARAYTNGNIVDIQSDINVVRTRAGLEETSASDIPSLKIAIAYERRHEFAFECQRWFDLVRTKTATLVLDIDENYMLFPIPQNEITTNNLMTQNPGY
jgi:starch-binding outer membrane protein, SusD/RagB family